jgi:hypothetical protein
MVDHELIRVLAFLAVIGFVSLYLWRDMNDREWKRMTKPCPTCKEAKRINIVSTWAGETAGDPCPTCHELGRIPR